MIRISGVGTKPGKGFGVGGRDLCGGFGKELGRSDKVIGSVCESKDGGDFRSASEFDLGEACLRLYPAKRLFDALAAALTEAVAGMVRRAPVDGGLAARLRRIA